MRVHGISVGLRHIALLIVFSVSTASALSAQTQTTAGVEASLVPGRTAWITLAGGPEEKARILAVAGDSVTALVDNSTRRFPITDVVRVRVRQSDSVLNGALIGAGAAVASGLLMCKAMESWETCRDDVGPMIRTGALGAAIGIGVDALIRGRKTVYEAQRSVRLDAAPIIGRDAAGLQISLRF